MNLNNFILRETETEGGAGKGANIEINLETATKFLKERGAHVYLNDKAFNEAAIKNSSVKEAIDKAVAVKADEKAKSFRDKDKRIIREIVESLGIQISEDEKIPTTNADGKHNYSDYLKYVGKLISDKTSELTELSKKTNEPDKDAQTKIENLTKLVAQKDALLAKKEVDLSEKTERLKELETTASKIESQFKQTKINAFIDAEIENELKKYTHSSEKMKSLIAKEIRAELEGSYEFELENDKVKVLQKIIGNDGDVVKVTTDNKSLSTFVQTLELLKELSPAAADTAKKPLQKTKTSNDLAHDALRDNGGESNEDRWKARVAEKGLYKNDIEAVKLRAEFGLEISDSDKELLKTVK